MSTTQNGSAKSPSMKAKDPSWDGPPVGGGVTKAKNKFGPKGKFDPSKKGPFNKFDPKKKFNQPRPPTGDASAVSGDKPHFDKKNFGPKKFGPRGKFDPNKKGGFGGPKRFGGKFDPKKKGQFQKGGPRFNKNFKPKTTDDASTENASTENASAENAGNKKEFIKKVHISPAYTDAVHILRQMSLKRGSLNMLIGTLKEQKNIKQVYALAIKVIKNQNLIKEIVEEFPQPEGSKFDPLFIEVLLADMIFGQKHFVKYRATKETQFVLESETKILKFYESIKDKPKYKTNIVEPRVRYIRINLIKTNMDDFIEKLKQVEFTQKKYSKETTFEQFKELALEMTAGHFMVDFHFGDMLLFHNDDIKKLTDLEIYKEFLFAIQDKSSMLAIEAMALQPGMKILDACAAPGMKTVAVASRLNNECTLYANDMDVKRYKQMRTFMHKFGANTKKLSNFDFSAMDRTEYSGLDVILLDPSCSGSGMARRFDYGQQNEEDDLKQDKRVAKLAKFQLALIEAALKLKPKKIVYCTCSKLQTENEDVVNHLLVNNPKIAYEVINPMPSWPVRGTGDYEFSSRCLRSDLVSTLTGGFFCCVLQRKEGATDDEEEEEDVQMEEATEVKVEVKIEVKEEQASQEPEPEQTQSPPKVSTRRSARTKRVATTSSQEESEAASEVADDVVPQTPRKSKRLRK